ncbi:Undecaprenol kinase [compost metagenome]
MRRFFYSLMAAWAGIAFSIRNERHMRIHMAAAAVVCLLGLLLGLTLTEWAVILLAIGGVVCTEMINTAIEQAVNLASPEFHPIAKIAKDVAAGAVLIAAFLAAAIGLLILGPPLWHLLFA